jgi:hypothetical protein
MSTLAHFDALPHDPWQDYVMALDDLTARLNRITKALEDRKVSYALVGGQAVAIWVATKDPAAVRTTKDVDILLRRDDLPKARASALSAGMDYFEVMNVGMFLDHDDPNPRHGVHLVWAGEKVRPADPAAAPGVDEHVLLGAGRHVVSLAGLVRMKLTANRDHDRVHLRDLIDVGLVDRSFLDGLPVELAQRLEALLTEAGR